MPLEKMSLGQISLEQNKHCQYCPFYMENLFKNYTWSSDFKNPYFLLLCLVRIIYTSDVPVRFNIRGLSPLKYVRFKFAFTTLSITVKNDTVLHKCYAYCCSVVIIQSVVMVCWLSLC